MTNIKVTLSKDIKKETAVLGKEGKIIAQGNTDNPQARKELLKKAIYGKSN
jgi:deoxycytidylate deaminase